MMKAVTETAIKVGLISFGIGLFMGILVVPIWTIVWFLNHVMPVGPW
jgi:hypothetical protein